MTIEQFRAENFRCLELVDLAIGQHYNLVVGPNASGKTSLLEALSYLGRGRSFRGAGVQDLVRRGEKDLLVFGRVQQGGRYRKVGIRNGREGLEIRVDGEGGSAADLAEALPLQLIDPDVHDLIGGGPEHRRRFVDWIAFHVEHEFLEAWRRFRRVLKQRNAALKSGQGLEAWSKEFVELGSRVDSLRRRALDVAADHLGEQAEALLGVSVGFEYRSGWADGQDLGEALAVSLARDLEQGSSQVGPHRAEVVISTSERRARKVVSRGQQKLLACAMILGATAVVQESLGERMLLLLDDPAAELDRDSLGRLMKQVYALDCQVVATALEPRALEFPENPSVFHVEHGKITPA